MSFIHHTAHVHESVKLHHGCWIGPNCVVDEGAVIGHYAIIGGPSEHRDFYDDPSPIGVYIGKNVRIFEHATVQSGTIRKTCIHDGAVIFNKTHVGHDCTIESGAIIGGQVSLAGHCYIHQGANISGKSCLSQRVVVGDFAFLGGFSYLTKNIPPGEKWVGNPPRFIGMNDVGLERAGVTPARIAYLKLAWETQHGIR